METVFIKKEEYTAYLKATLENAGLSLSDEQYAQLLSYYELLIERNRVMNLTAITDFADVAVKHFADSLAPLAEGSLSGMFEKSACTILDLGTGAGFPGLPLAIALPDAKITLADSLQKRTNFLEEVKESLKLDNIEIVNGRAEDLGKLPRYRENFDIVVSRAVADYRVLCEYCLPFVKEDGAFIAWKGPAAYEEAENAAEAVKILGGQTPIVQTYSLPGTEEVRTIILTKKTTHTPEKYPRRAGIPSKRPL